MDITSGRKGIYRKLLLAGQFWERGDMEALEQYFDICIASGKPRVILDLERLTFINSQALGLLVRLHNLCSDAGGKLILYRPQSSVREVIEISDLPQFITIVDSPEVLDRLSEDG
ncbi:MAG: STAS domain-containing protein [Chitinispirillaceae bacterium]|nr:STAS domain-containing protein [Chitinispirillaceae bacterium]